jgi:recombination protein RecA
MARASKNKDATDVANVDSAVQDDWTAELIRSLNKEIGTRVAFNLSFDEAPTLVKRWISTGSRQLDYIISGKRNGGVPEGRVTEISGLPSIGKSHIAFQLCRSVQRMGGLVIYIDTENAVPLDKLRHMGIDVGKRFVYCDTHCTEEVFSIMESTILKVKSLMGKNIPVLIVWDSVAATSPKAELEGDYDKDTIGLQARVIAKGMRKIVGVIGQNNVTLVCLNQLKTKIGVMFGDPMTTPGGNAIPYHASVRLRLTGGTQIKDKNDIVVGINVIATTNKNKVTSPFRKAHFAIHFGKGTIEHEQLFDALREFGEKNGPVPVGEKQEQVAIVEGVSAWKTLKVVDVDTGEVTVEKKFTKNQFGELFENPEYNKVLEDLLERALTVNLQSDATSEEVSLETAPGEPIPE